MSDDGDIRKKVDEQEKRISHVEKYLEKNDPNFTAFSEKQKTKQATSQEETEKIKSDSTSQKPHQDSEINFPSFSFSQIITFLGVLGVIIGVISFFFYAVANNIIGETAQIGIGIAVGLALFVISYRVRGKHIVWSNIVFGGAYFVEILTIGVGVQVYENIPMLMGISLLLFFLISSLIFSITFSSRTIAYFSLVGGYIIPSVTGFPKEQFIVIFYILLGVALLVLSAFKNWPDIRLTSIIVLIIYVTSYYNIQLRETVEKEMLLMFWILIFIIYNAASLWSSISNKSKIPAIDSVIVGILPVVLISYISALFEIPSEYLGLIFMIFSFLYLGGIALLKNIREIIDASLSYTLLSAGVITLNLGFLAFLIDTLGYKFLMVFFVVQWLLFSIVKHEVKEKYLFIVGSYIFLFLSILWYMFTVWFSGTVEESTFFLLVHLAIPVGFIYLYKIVERTVINGGGFIITGYLFILSVYSYLQGFLESSHALGDVILSVLWLGYCLVLFSNIKEKKARILLVVLLGITLLKIAFRDLLFLEGVYRIVGFTLFGVLLLIGGYFLKNERLF